MPYGTTKAGPGRYVILTDYQGAQLGYAWTSDAGGLGFVPSSAQGVAQAASFRADFTAADKTKTSARQAFDALAARRDSIIGGTVRVGDLGLLPA